MQGTEGERGIADALFAERISNLILRLKRFFLAMIAVDRLNQRIQTRKETIL